MAPLNVKNSFQGGALSTSLPREGLDIGPRPDFWGDLNKMQSRLRPRQQRMSSEGLQGGGGAAPAAQAPADFYDEPTYGTMIGMGPNSSGVAYQPWEPGMAFSPMAPPAQTGTRRVRRAGQVIDRGQTG